MERRFPGAAPVKLKEGDQTTYDLVSELLGSLRIYTKSSIDVVLSLALQREAQEIPWLVRKPTEINNPVSEAPFRDQTGSFMCYSLGPHQPQEI